MTDYELMVILKPLLPEDIRMGIEGKIKGYIEKNKGSIKSTDVWGKRHLSYKIKNHEEGYYIVYTIQLPPAAVDGLNNEIVLISDILRHLLVKADKPTTKVEKETKK